MGAFAPSVALAGLLLVASELSSYAWASQAVCQRPDQSDWLETKFWDVEGGAYEMKVEIPQSTAPTSAYAGAAQQPATTWLLGQRRYLQPADRSWP